MTDDVTGQDRPDRGAISRRSLLRRSAAAGVLVWSAPVVRSLSVPAFASHAGSPFTECYAIKIERDDGAVPPWRCTAVSGALGTGRCLTDTDIDGHPEGCTPFIAGGGTVSVAPEGATDKRWTVTLPEGCTFGGVAGIKTGQGCHVDSTGTHTTVATVNGREVITISSPDDRDISHIELVFCCQPTTTTVTTTEELEAELEDDGPGAGDGEPGQGPPAGRGPGSSAGTSDAGLTSP